MIMMDKDHGIFWGVVKSAAKSPCNKIKKGEKAHPFLFLRALVTPATSFFCDGSAFFFSSACAC
jgi:hypothetical protein